MNEQQLSQRLEKVASFLTEGSHFADIGSDHAYLPCYVCLKDDQARSIAGEVNKGPFDSALAEVKKHQLEDRIEVRLGDGLDVIKQGEVQDIVIAGMGGPLIRDILDRGKEKLASIHSVIAQPNIDARSLRKWFLANGFELTDEAILEENGHIYEILVAKKGDPEAPYHDVNKELLVGPFLLQERNSIFIKKWSEEVTKKEYVLSQVKKATNTDEQKIKQLQTEISWLKEVIYE